MRDIIIDAETLDTKDTAVIPSIGARLCNLETGEMGEGFHVNLDVQAQIDAGYTISASTLAFWLNQQQAARSYLIDIMDRKVPLVSRQVGFSMLHQFISSVKNANVWGNGISFDLGLCIREWGPDNLPWEFWNEQDVRSIVSFGRRVFGVQFKKEVQFEGTAHNPLDDATHEAQYLMEYFKHGRELATGAAIMGGELHDLRIELQQAREIMAQPVPSLDTACLEAIAKEQREVSELRQALDKAHACILELESPTCGTVDCSNLTAEEVAEIRNAMNSSPSVLLPTAKLPFPKDSETMLKNIAVALGASYDDIVASQRSAAKYALRNHWQVYKDRKAELQAEEFEPELLESIADELEAAEAPANPLDELTALDQEIAAECRDDGVKLEGMTEDPAPAKRAHVSAATIPVLAPGYSTTFKALLNDEHGLAAFDCMDDLHKAGYDRPAALVFPFKLGIKEERRVAAEERGVPVIAVGKADMGDNVDEDPIYGTALRRRIAEASSPAKPAETIPTLYCLIRDASDEVVAAMWGVHRIKAANSVRALFDENDNLRAPVAMLYKEGSKVPSKTQGRLEAKNIRLVPWYGSDMACDDLPNSRLRARIIEASMPANEGAKK